MNKNIFLVLAIIPILVLPVYAQEFTGNMVEKDCSKVIEKIKEKHWDTLKSYAAYYPDKPNWYAAGLMLGLHYVEKDCDTAEEKMNEILDNLWTGQKENGGKEGYADTKTTDKISFAIRFIKSLL